MAEQDLDTTIGGNVNEADVTREMLRARLILAIEDEFEKLDLSGTSDTSAVHLKGSAHVK